MCVCVLWLFANVCFRQWKMTVMIMMRMTKMMKMMMMTMMTTRTQKQSRQQGPQPGLPILGGDDDNERLLTYFAFVVHLRPSCLLLLPFPLSRQLFIFFYYISLKWKLRFTAQRRLCAADGPGCRKASSIPEPPPAFVYVNINVTWLDPKHTRD